MITLREEARKTVRKPTAKLKITWAGGSVDYAEAEPLQSVNRASLTQQVIRGIGEQRKWAFCETDNPSASFALLDDMRAMPDNEDEGYLVGWWGDNSNISDSSGYFTQPSVLQVKFAPTTVEGYKLQGYLIGNEHQEYAVDFDVTAYYKSGDNYFPCKYSDDTTATVQVRGNLPTSDPSGLFRESLRNVSMVEYSIIKWSHPGAFVKITAAHDNLTREYTDDDIMSISLLEEAEGSVGALPIGSISCNELDITLQNIDDTFSIGNTSSLLSDLAISNRRIEPYIGFVIHDDSGNPTHTEYIPKGVYWTRDWNVSLQGTTASTSALDRLGLLQNIEYNGIGNINYNEGVAEKSYWDKDTSLYDVAFAVLNDLRMTYMRDLEFDIDTELRDVKIPLAFFKKQSYFDLIKTIAQAGIAYAFMDVPTDEEREERAGCADILRIVRLDRLYPEYAFFPRDVITLDDIIDQTIQVRRDDMVNVVSVPWEEYEIRDGVPKSVEGDDDRARLFTISNEQAIKEHGRIEYEYSRNNLIQTADRAEEIAEIILDVFSRTQRVCELNTFGDVTRRIGDIYEIPEYQKHGINSSGHYAAMRIQTNYDGGLRQSLSCRRIGDTGNVADIKYIEETGNAKIIIDETGNRTDTITEGGL
jgi:hypothetical protein